MSGGEQIRDYVHIDALIDHLIKISLNNRDNGIVNICSGKGEKLRIIINKWIIENEYKISRREKNKIAQLCLSILSNETQKSVLILWSQNLRYNEIADRLDVPPGTVMSSLARARIKVAQCIKKRLKNDK